MSAFAVQIEAGRLEKAYPDLLAFLRGFWNFSMIEEGSALPPLVDRFFPCLPKDWAERFVEQAAAARSDETLHAFFADRSEARDRVDWMQWVCLIDPEDFTVIHEAAKRNYEAGNWRPENPHGPMWREPFPRRRGRR